MKFKVKDGKLFYGILNLNIGVRSDIDSKDLGRK